MVDGLFNQTNFLLAQKMLDATVLRHRALASNLANIETKGYKRVDVAQDFQSQLTEAASSGEKDRIMAATPKLKVDETARFVRGDGNNVELDSELMEMDKNSLNHEFLTQYMTGNFNRLRAAISGNPE